MPQKIVTVSTLRAIRSIITYLLMMHFSLSFFFPRKSENVLRHLWYIYTKPENGVKYYLFPVFVLLRQDLQHAQPKPKTFTTSVLSTYAFPLGSPFRGPL